MADTPKSSDIACVDLVSEDEFSGSTVSDDSDAKNEETPTVMNGVASNEMPRVKTFQTNGQTGWEVGVTIPLDTNLLLFRAFTLHGLKNVITRKLNTIALSCHKRDSPEVNDKYQCQACHQYFKEPDIYIKHIKVCPIICRICGNLFPTEEDGKQHIKLHNWGTIPTPASKAQHLKVSKKIGPSHKGKNAKKPYTPATTPATVSLNNSECQAKQNGATCGCVMCS